MFQPLGQRVLWSEEAKTLFVADAHFGKSALLRKQVPGVPAGSSAHDLGRLDGLVKKTSAEAVYFLGDTLHSPAVRDTPLFSHLRNWVAAQKCTLHAIPGNHDLHAMGFLEDAGFRIGAEGQLWNGVELLHSPPDDCSKATLCGHLHPGVVWKGLAGASLRLPCFWVRRQACCLPAFGSFTGLHIVPAKKGDKIWAVADDRVFEIAW